MSDPLLLIKSCVNIYTAPPSAPSNVMIMNESHVENFSIILSWDPPLDAVLVDSYSKLTTTTTHPLSTTDYTVVLEGKYNIPQQIRLSAINCAESSEEVTRDVHIGKCHYVGKPYTIHTMKLCPIAIVSFSWLLSSHSTCEWQCNTWPLRSWLLPVLLVQQTTILSRYKIASTFIAMIQEEVGDTIDRKQTSDYMGRQQGDKSIHAGRCG